MIFKYPQSGNTHNLLRALWKYIPVSHMDRCTANLLINLQSTWPFSQGPMPLRHSAGTLLDSSEAFYKHSRISLTIFCTCFPYHSSLISEHSSELCKVHTTSAHLHPYTDPSTSSDSFQPSIPSCLVLFRASCCFLTACVFLSLLSFIVKKLIEAPSQGHIPSAACFPRVMDICVWGLHGSLSLPLVTALWVFSLFHCLPLSLPLSRGAWCW